ncbi:MAG TPA: alginate lyase family protein [bacterium]|nr:alginate lyase family protein [bacterium]HPQ65376.1 alginate lyase family protein [bacterium]
MKPRATNSSDPLHPEAGGCFFIRPGDRRAAVEAVLRDFPEAFPNAVADADDICGHVFDLLGSGKTGLGPDIDWHRDFKSGERWNPLLPYGRGEPYLRLHDRSDVKVPWDLSSFLHLPTLGKAFWYTGRPAYAREFEEEVSDWIDRNPRPLGINWACTMKTAHRALNWVWGYHFFREAPEIEAAFWRRFLASLEEHGRHIEKNLEDERPANNHYLLGLATLFYLGSAFPGMNRARRWRRVSLKLLLREIMIQVSPDGADYEGSIYYHRFATEIFLSVLALDRRGDRSFRGQALGRLEKMLEFILAYTGPDGNAPRIGDQDDGRVQITGRYSSWSRFDHRDLLALGAALFDREDFAGAAGDRHEDSLWLLGEEALRPMKRAGETVPAPRSRAFPGSGYYIMRDRGLYLIVDALASAPGAPTAHRHNSRLSFELTADGASFLIDPGTYLYTADPELRNSFRGTAAHNTVVVDGREQGVLDGNNLFSLPPGGKVRVISWSSEDSFDRLDAEYVYSRLPGGHRRLAHRRQFFFSKTDRFWVVRDTLRARGRHGFSSFFHFAPGVGVRLEGETVIAERDGSSLLIQGVGGDGATRTEVVEGWVSDRYGHREKAPVAVRRGTFRNRASFGTILIPRTAGSGDARTAERTEAARARLESL